MVMVRTVVDAGGLAGDLVVTGRSIMDEILRPEVVMKIGPECKRFLVSTATREELDAYLNPAYKRMLVLREREKDKWAVCGALEQILQRQLGPVPAAVRNALRQCTLAELPTLVNPALDAATWDEFLAALPTPAP